VPISEQQTAMPVDGDAGIDRLARVGHRAALDQIRDAITDESGVDSEVAAVTDTGHNGVGNCANANLDGGAVFNITSNVAGDVALNLADGTRIERDRRPRDRHDVVNLAGGQVRIAIGPRRLFVDLGDNHSRLRDRGLLIIVGERKAVLPLIVRRAGLNEYNVGADGAVIEVRNQLGEMERDRSHRVRFDEFAKFADRAIAGEREDVGMLGLECRGIGDAAKKNTGVADAMALIHQALDQGLRLARALSPYDVITGPDNTGEIEIVCIKLLRHGRKLPGSDRRSVQRRLAQNNG
jgi:hypothetical protein